MEGCCIGFLAHLWVRRFDLNMGLGRVLGRSAPGIQLNMLPDMPARTSVFSALS